MESFAPKRRVFSILVVMVLMLTLVCLYSLHYTDKVNSYFYQQYAPEPTYKNVVEPQTVTPPVIDGVADPAIASPAIQRVAVTGQRTREPIVWQHESLTGTKVLILAMTSASTVVTRALEIFEHLRIKYTIHIVNKDLSSLYLEENPQYATIMVHNLKVYNHLDDADKSRIKTYCMRYKVGIVAFVSPSLDIKDEKFPFKVKVFRTAKVFEIAKQSPLFRITKPGLKINITNPSSVGDWTHFEITKSQFSAVAFALGRTSGIGTATKRYCVAIQGEDATDKIRTVYMNHGFHFWMEKMLFLDALYHVSRGLLKIPIKRYILLDVDDTLRASSSSRPTVADTMEMVDATLRLRKYVDNFHFNLGIIGIGHDESQPSLRKANEYLLEHKESFYWFDHTYSHPDIVRLKDPDLVRKQYEDNQKFIKAHDIPTKEYSYLVTPFHSGIYPVYKPAYDAWKTIGVSAVSTVMSNREPALQYLPSDVRRGYIYQGIKVLPRKAIDIWTTSINVTYTRRNKLMDSVRGGKIFGLLLIDLINIYMTHYVNFSHDRMGLVVFEELVKFTKIWTNLELLTVKPLELADIFFTNYPEEKEPVWTLPCEYGSQLKYWSKPQTCPGKQYPDVIIIGPAKYGTGLFSEYLKTFRTAKLKKFITSRLHFFTENYLNGIDWYVDQFRSRSNEPHTMYIDADWMAFTDKRAPQRIFSFLPEIRIIIVLSSPQQIIYQCVQEILEKEKSSATFNDVFSQGTEDDSHFAKIKSECLKNGSYHDIFSNWLSFFSARQMFVVNQVDLQEEPTRIMNEAAGFLGFPHRDFERSVWFNEVTGVLCRWRKSTCENLTASAPPPISAKVSQYLDQHLAQSNNRLLQTFIEKGIPVPHWLYDTHVTS